MARISLRSTGSEVSITVDGKDITNAVLADPWPLLEMAPASNPGQSRLTVTLTGDIDAEVNGEVETR